MRTIQRRKVLGLGAALVACALALSACGTPNTDDTKGGATTGAATDTPTDAPTTGGGGTATAGWNQPVFSLNYDSSNGHASANHVVTYMARGMWSYYDADLNFIENKEFGEVKQVSDNPLTVEISINPDAKWSDGVPVTAADTLLMWASVSGQVNTITEDDVDYDDDWNVIVPEDQVYFDAGSPSMALIEETPTISEDGQTLTLVYSKPFGEFQYDWMQVNLPAHVVTMRALGIDDPAEATAAFVAAVNDRDNAALAKIAQVWNYDFDITAMPTGDDAALAISSGAFLIGDIVAGEYVSMKKNPDYTWGPVAKVDEIFVRYNEDPMAQVQALVNGELDIIHPQVTTDVLAAVQDQPGIEYESSVEGTYEHVDLTFNNGGPFDPATYDGDEEKALKVRMAFLKTIPRQQIVDTLVVPLQPDATTRDSFNVMPGAPTYDNTIANNTSAQFAEVDIDGAVALLQEAGVEDLEVGFMYGLSNKRRAQEFQLIHESAAKAGINVVDLGTDEWGSKLGDGTYDAVLFGWQSTSTGVNEPAANYVKGGQNNFGGYFNPKVDELYSQLQTALDPADQEQINIDVETELYGDGFGVVLFQFPAVSAWTEKLLNVSVCPISATIFWNYWEWEMAS